MSTVKFSEPVPAAEEEAQNTELVVHDEQLPSNTGDFEQNSAEVRLLQLPRIQIVNKVGKLSDEFPKNVGEWIYDGEPIGGDPLRVIVLGAPHWLEEDLDFDDNEIPRRFRNLSEARKQGFSHVDDGPGANRVVDVASLKLLIQHEDGDLEAPDGTTWCLGELGVRKGGFKDTWILWNSQRAIGRLRDAIGGTIAGSWDLTINLKSYNGNSWYSPRLKKPKGAEAKVSEDFQAFLKENFGEIVG